MFSSVHMCEVQPPLMGRLIHIYTLVKVTHIYVYLRLTQNINLMFSCHKLRSWKFQYCECVLLPIRCTLYIYTKLSWNESENINSKSISHINEHAAVIDLCYILFCVYIQVFNVYWAFFLASYLLGCNNMGCGCLAEIAHVLVLRRWRWCQPGKRVNVN